MKLHIQNFFVFFVIMVLSTLALIAQDEKKPMIHNLQKTFTIDSCLHVFSPDKVIQTKTGYQYWFVDKDFIDGTTIKMSVVEPNSAVHPPHKHESDEFYFILEGTAEFYLNGETRIAGAYSSFYCPSNSKHGIKNAGDTELKYLVIREYKKE